MNARYLNVIFLLVFIAGCAQVVSFPIDGSVERSEYPYIEHVIEKIQIIGISRYPEFQNLITEKTHIDIELELTNNGKMVQTRILTPSNKPAIDATMLDIIRYSAPYPPFDDDMNMDRLIIQKRWFFVPQ